MPDNITSEEIVRINRFLGYHPLNVNLVGSALASVHYHPDVKTQIAAIVQSLIKNHAFQDGNKRTATLVYHYLCKRNNIKPKNDAILFNTIVKIAESKFTVDQVKHLLF